MDGWSDERRKRGRKGGPRSWMASRAAWVAISEVYMMTAAQSCGGVVAVVVVGAIVVAVVGAFVVVGVVGGVVVVAVFVVVVAVEVGSVVFFAVFVVAVPNNKDVKH